MKYFIIPVFYGLLLTRLSGQLPSLGLPNPTERTTTVGNSNPIPSSNPAFSTSDLEQILLQNGEDTKAQYKVRYAFEDHSKEANALYYHKAYDTIQQMLAQQRPLSVKQAVFLTENAYYGKPVYFDWFSFEIAEYVTIIKQSIAQRGYDFNKPSARKWGIHHFLTDTTYLNDNQGRIIKQHLPFSYDFYDIWGKEDWTKQFVGKLISTGNGQCHSLPLLYLILAEALQVEAWLSFSPSHTFIKVKDNKGNLLNYETTNGQYTTDVWLQSSGFIKAEALRSKVYMDTLSKKEAIATCLIDLAKGYAHKFGYDKFVLDCTEKALQYSPKNVYALQLQADYHTSLFAFVIQQLGRPSLKELPNYPEAYVLYQKMHQQYQKIDAIGYETMPEAIYTEWIKSFDKMKARQVIKYIQP